MNAAIRAKRILAPLANFRSADAIEAWPADLQGLGLGDTIGLYRANKDDACSVGIYSDGLAWQENHKVIAIKYSEIADVQLPAGKSRGALSLKTARGDFMFPVEGGHGKFADSLEFLRYIDRVIGDLKRT